MIGLGIRTSPGRTKRRSGRLSACLNPGRIGVDALFNAKAATRRRRLQSKRVDFCEGINMELDAVLAAPALKLLLEFYPK